MNRRCFWLGDGRGVGDVSQTTDLIEQLAFVRPPVRGKGQGRAIGRSPFETSDLIEDMAQQRRHEVFGRVRPAPQKNRRVVTQAALELPGEPARFDGAPPERRFAYQEDAVLSREGNGWDLHRPIAQADNLDPMVTGDRHRSEGGAEINTELVAHRSSSLQILSGRTSVDRFVIVIVTQRHNDDAKVYAMGANSSHPHNLTIGPGLDAHAARAAS